MANFLLNYALIQVSILAFMAPFYLWYRFSHKGLSAGNIPFSHHLEHFFSSKPANFLVFFWAMGEALIWFVIPEFLLLLMVFMRVRNKRQLVLFDIYGTAAGVLVAYLLNLPAHLISRLPFIQPRMLEEVAEWYGSMGIWGLVQQPFSGVPFKVFTHTAEDFGFPLLAFLVLAIIVRISRYVIAYGVFVAMYPVLHKYVRRNYFPLFFIASFIFSVLLHRVYQSYA